MAAHARFRVSRLTVAASRTQRSIVLLSASLLTLLSVPVVEAQPSVANAESSSAAEPTIYSQAQAEADGNFSSVETTLSNGAEIYNYDIFGMHSFTIVPPPGFSPLTATASELAEYGFPPKPSGNADAIATWTQAMKNATSFPTSGLTFAVGDASSSSFNGSLNAIYKGNWSGYAATATTKTNFVAAEAQWVLPTITYCGPDANWLMWTGLGGQAGTPSTDLYQSGISFNGFGDNTWDGWYEYSNSTHQNPAVRVGTNLSLATGRTIFNSTFYNQSTQITWYYIENVTDGVVFHQGFNEAGYYSGYSAEAELEEPAYYSGGYAAQFTNFSVTSAMIENLDNVWFPMGNTAYDYDWIADSSTQGYLAEPSGLYSNGTAFDEDFGACPA